ncbi:uncharacterized protein PV06_09952 [Exophiala oligosperma]|uniref:JmjC domain-containing protein n=1 Tax=Exophiala oligosperma TaxID=215243 RepID=A0A0D2D6J9_9EURO|nr:uncharacterized protein PV06_09952 [Exophiala oligosperma]KIW37975.1 hypothetical protein PV06_09952 [Exophiala oligosperma]
MPPAKPCAAFEPIPPDFNLQALVESTPNFEWVVRIHCDMIDHQGLENFEKLVLIHVILGGKPLVIEGYEARLDKWTFALQWLRDNCGSKVEHARDLTKKINVPLTIGHYLNNMALLTNQWTPRNYKDPERQRMYLKDIDCPPLWHDKLADVIPPSLFYLNESTGDIGGFGAVDENDPTRPGMRKGRGIAKAGDLMSSLPKEMRAENMMCYIGHEGTYTPAHREMCASLGQNIMVEASTGAPEDGRPTTPGSSIWFMTESKERAVVSEYWLSRLGHDIEIENHFAQINAWKSAPFQTYVVEQKPGDFILIPPLAPHQVWNRGTRTMKVAWNRTTVETLEMAMREALPRARLVCRDEQYKNKGIVYYTLQKYSKLLKLAEKFKQKALGSKHKVINDTKVRQLEKDFRRLHQLYTSVLVSESFLTDKQEKKVELIPYDSNITCSYCRCNIFNRFLTCPSCVGELPNGEEDTYDICMDCYVMGRSCACTSKLRWAEQWPWADLLQKHEYWRHQILQYEGRVTEKSPVSLKTELDRLGNKRTLAQICQLELARRPFKDIHRPPSSTPAQGDNAEEQEVDDNGNVKKKKKAHSKTFLSTHARCHIDSHWEPTWKQAPCSTCDRKYCYGVLFRAYDMQPQDILADPDWQCPSCRNICACRTCRKRPDHTPYIPSGTVLGHDTRAVADPRSVESLVDFSYSNLGWIQKAGDDGNVDSHRMRSRRTEADAALADTPQRGNLGDNYVDEGAFNDSVEDGILRLAHQEGIPIDPALGSGATPTDSLLEDEDIYEEHPEGARQAGVHSPDQTPWVPEGGVIRDYEHAYDFTEAITYDYPDPEIGRHIAPPTEEEQSGPASGHVPAAADESAGIEMIERKRKRKLDDDNRPYKNKKSAVKKNKKQRKSLIVKLPVDKEKLSQVDQMVNVAKQALNGVPVMPAPVIGSDLQALNAAEGNPQQVPRRNRDVEHHIVDNDDEFTPGRSRDRRKSAPDGALQPAPDAEITRRTTRVQNIHYEEPDEEEFDEILPQLWDPRTKAAPKVVRLEGPNSDSDDGSADSGESEDDLVFSAPSPPVKMAVDPALQSKSTISQQAKVQNTRPSATSQGKLVRPFETVPRKPAGEMPSLTTNNNSKTLEVVQANRRAKMAAIEDMDIENDFDDFDDFESSSQDSYPAESVSGPGFKQPAVPAKATVLNGHTNGTRVQQNRRSIAAKASAADWGQSDSDDEPSVLKASSSGWASVNTKTSTRGIAVKPSTPKKRGRPPKHPL